MTLILLAISLSIALCVIAYNFAISALPFMVGLTAFQYVYGTDAGFFMSGLAAIGAAPSNSRQTRPRRPKIPGFHP